VYSAGNAYITGDTGSTDFPTTPGALQRRGSGGAFVTKLNVTGTALVYSTFLGGSVGQEGFAIALDAAGNAYVTGRVSSADFPITPGAFQQTRHGRFNAFVAKLSPAAPACKLLAMVAGPPAELRVAVHADRGLATLTATRATNASVALPAFAPGTTDTLPVTATKLDQTAKAFLTLQATDVTGSSTTCDPALVTVGREPGARPAQAIRHVAQGESHVALTNGTPGADRVRLLVNGQLFEAADLHDGDKRTLDVSSAMRKGNDNTIVVVAHGPRDSSVAVLVSDS
jgi:hypothetical protein